jgi:hypothetical protein
LKPYGGLISALVALTILGNSLNLLVPRLISNAIDSYVRRQFVIAAVTASSSSSRSGSSSSAIFRAWFRPTPERGARLADAADRKDFAAGPAYIQRLTPATLLTT